MDVSKNYMAIGTACFAAKGFDLTYLNEDMHQIIGSLHMATKPKYHTSLACCEGT